LNKKIILRSRSLLISKIKSAKVLDNKINKITSPLKTMNSIRKATKKAQQVLKERPSKQIKVVYPF
jgi:hypothetical protein